MRKPTDNRTGFTLIELLVAMTVASLLIAILISTLQAVSGVTQSTGGRIEAEREARAAFEMLERDLSSSIRKEGGWIRVVADPDPPPTGEQPLWLIFLSAPIDHDRDAPGDVCVLSYRTGHDPLPGEEDPFPSLHRLVVAADDTFENALDRDTVDEDYFAENEATDKASRALSSWLAAGVIDIQFRAWSQNASFDLADNTVPTDQIEALEVTLEVLTKQGQRLFGTLPQAELRKRHAYRFTRRIPVPVASL